MKRIERRRPGRLRLALQAAVLAAVLAAGGRAEAWWQEAWSYRRPIQLDTTAQGADIAEDLRDVPVLIRLHPGNFDFAAVRSDGQDLRFVGPDDVTLLPHHVEQFDPIDETAQVWVQVPTISGGKNQEFVWMYYGNQSAEGGENPKGTYDRNQVLVFHLDEPEGPPTDVSAAANNAARFSGALGLPSAIGNGAILSGPGDGLSVPGSPSLTFPDGFTFSAWVRLPAPQADAYLFSRRQGDRSVAAGIDQTRPYVRVTAGADGAWEARGEEDIPLNTWHHVMVTGAPGGRVSFFLDGAERFALDVPGGLPEVAGDVDVGGSGPGGHTLAGDLDEVGLSDVPRPAGWARAAYASQGPDGSLYAVGDEQVHEAGGLRGFYLSIVLENVTLDGWVIIGLLLFMAAASCVVFVGKAVFLWLTDRENKEFLSFFSQRTGYLPAGEPAPDFPHATLYGVYRAGVESLKAWAGASAAQDPPERFLPARGMAAFRAALEEGFMSESQRMHSHLVVLTLAIAGGPFLGLLGTVWGVMNTFAAMAEAGEANITAIAPGVASALATTVVGLIVAIPALFAYNYLTTRIKNLTVDASLFVDRFALRVDEIHGEGP